jgi:hypothetical protein
VHSLSGLFAAIRAESAGDAMPKKRKLCGDRSFPAAKRLQFSVCVSIVKIAVPLAIPADALK